MADKNNTAEENSIKLTEYELFSGVRLIYIDAHAMSYQPSARESAQLLEINHCREGRFERHIGRQYYYLSAGDMSVSTADGSSDEVFFPTSHYHGISIQIDPALAPDSFSSILEGVNVSVPELLEKLCGNGGSLVIRSTDRLEHIFSELYTVPESIRHGYMRLKLLELLLFLSALEPESVRESDDRKGCTQSQAELAKEVCAFICSHISSRVTIEQMAEQFGVSPTQLKKSFRSVYGTSVYAFAKEQKMLTAARLLRETDRTVLDIAGECGYDNGSKFSKAFSSVIGMNPSDYRRK